MNTKAKRTELANKLYAVGFTYTRAHIYDAPGVRVWIAEEEVQVMRLAGPGSYQTAVTFAEFCTPNMVAAVAAEFITK